MTPTTSESIRRREMFRVSLLCTCWPSHSLAQMAGQTPWVWLEDRLDVLYYSDNGSPRSSNSNDNQCVSTQFKSACGFLEENVDERSLDSPCAHYLYGERLFQSELWLDEKSLTRFNIRIGKSGWR